MSKKDLVNVLKGRFPGLFPGTYPEIYRILKDLEKDGHDPEEILIQWEAEVYRIAFDCLRNCAEYDELLLEAIQKRGKWQR